MPLEVAFSAASSFDNDKGDKLEYEWQLAGQKQEARQGPETKYLFTKPGAYLVRLTVTDNHGLSSSKEIRIEAGNEPPEVAIHFAGNKSFYWPQKPVAYQVEVSDKEDGSLAAGQIAPQDVLVTVDLADMGTDLTLLAQEQKKSASLYLHPGQQFINQSDCLSCHQEKSRSVGPSWLQVAERYQGQPGAVEALTQKVIRGGSGNWGQAAMSAHPQLKEAVVSEMVKYLLDIGKKQQAANRLPAKGTFRPDEKAEGLYVFRALYQDKGAGTSPAQVGQGSQVLRHARVGARFCDELGGAIRFDKAYIRFPKEKSFIAFRDIDLSGVGNLQLAYASPFPCRLSFRAGKPNGPEIGAADLSPTPAVKGSAIDWKQQQVKLRPLKGKQTLYVVASGFPTGQDGKSFLSLDWIHFLP